MRLLTNSLFRPGWEQGRRPVPRTSAVHRAVLGFPELLLSESTEWRLRGATRTQQPPLVGPVPPTWGLPLTGGVMAAPALGPVWWTGQGQQAPWGWTGVPMPQGQMMPVRKATCVRWGCFQPSAQHGEYCSQECLDLGPIWVRAPGAVPCTRPSCPRCSWNGGEGEYCSSRCRDFAAPGVPAVTCARDGCPFPPSSGKAGEHCSLECHEAGPRYWNRLVEQLFAAWLCARPSPIDSQSRGLRV